MLEFVYCVSSSAKVSNQLHLLQLAVYATHKSTATAVRTPVLASTRYCELWKCKAFLQTAQLCACMTVTVSLLTLHAVTSSLG